MKPGVVKITTNPRVCQGCRACEATCSVFHFGLVNPFSTGIKIIELQELGKFKQIVCQQCIDMVCAQACPENAIVRNTYSGAVEINDQCNACGACIEACPINAITMISIDGKQRAFKCDLCGGAPQCVEVCPRQAIGW